MCVRFLFRRGRGSRLARLVCHLGRRYLRSGRLSNRRSQPGRRTSPPQSSCSRAMPCSFRSDSPYAHHTARTSSRPGRALPWACGSRSTDVPRRADCDRPTTATPSAFRHVRVSPARKPTHPRTGMLGRSRYVSAAARVGGRAQAAQRRTAASGRCRTRLGCVAAPAPADRGQPGGRRADRASSAACPGPLWSRTLPLWRRMPRQRTRGRGARWTCSAGWPAATSALCG